MDERETSPAPLLGETEKGPSTPIFSRSQEKAPLSLHGNLKKKTYAAKVRIHPSKPTRVHSGCPVDPFPHKQELKKYMAAKNIEEKHI